MSEHQSAFTPAEIPDGKVTFKGKTYMSDAKGALLPVETIRPQHLLEDALVREQFGWFLALVDQVSRFRGHLFADLGAFDALIAEKYGVEKGGPKGNRTYMTVDDCYRISIRVRDTLDFGPERQASKALIDDCLRDWSEDAAAPLRLIVAGAFNVARKARSTRQNSSSSYGTTSPIPNGSQPWKPSVLGIRYVNKSLKNTIEDIGYLITNPETGVREETYITGNPGKGIVAGDPDGAGPIPAQPEAIRDYEAIELSWNRRFAGNWSARIGYTYSQLEGTYSGLASSDEFGRTDPNVSRAFDSLHNAFDLNGNLSDGPLYTELRTRSTRSSSIASAGARRSASTSTTAAARRSPPSGTTTAFRSSRSAVATLVRRTT